MNAASIFNDLYGHMAEARCRLRIDRRDVVERCLCGSFQITRVDTDQGSYDAKVASVKLMQPDLPQGKMLSTGTIIEFQRHGAQEWKSCRVGQKSDPIGDGLFSISIEAEYA